MKRLILFMAMAVALAIPSKGLCGTIEDFDRAEEVVAGDVFYMVNDEDGTPADKSVTAETMKEYFDTDTVYAAGTGISLDATTINCTVVDTDTQLTDEQVQDKVGAMATGNTETLITVSYQDDDGTLDFVVDNDLANYSNTSSGFQTATDVTTYCETTQNYLKTSENNDSADDVSLLDVQGALSNDFHNAGGSESDPVYSAWDKDYDDITNKPTIPTDNSELANGAGYITSETDDQKIDVSELDGTTLKLSLEGDGEAAKEIDLSSLQDGNTTYTAGDNLELNGTEFSLAGSVEILQDLSIGQTLTIGNMAFTYEVNDGAGVLVAAEGDLVFMLANTEMGGQQYDSIYLQPNGGFGITMNDIPIMGMVDEIQIVGNIKMYGDVQIETDLSVEDDLTVWGVIHLADGTTIADADDLGGLENIVDTVGGVNVIAGKNLTMDGDFVCDKFFIDDSQWGVCVGDATSPPKAVLHVDNGNCGNAAFTECDMLVEDDMDTRLVIACGNNYGGYLDFGDNGADMVSSINCDSFRNNLEFYTNGNNSRMIIDDDGGVYIGATVNSDKDETLYVDGNAYVATNLSVVGNTQVTGDLLVDAGTLYVDGDNDLLIIDGDLSVSNNVTVGGLIFDESGKILTNLTKSITFTIVKPLDLDEADTLPVWRNDSGKTFVITQINADSDTDDTVFTLANVDYNDYSDLSVIGVVQVNVDGVNVYTDSLAASDLSYSEVLDTNVIVFNNDAADDPNYISCTIEGYYKP